MRIETLAIIKKPLEAIWANPKYQGFPIGNFIYPKFIETDSILFIGINPSLVKSQKPNEPYELEESVKNIPYFKKMKELANECGTSWAHLDLFYFVHTSEKKIFEIVKNENGAEFLLEQLRITNDLIKAVKAKVIVVCNALAASFLGRYPNRKISKNIKLDYQYKFDEYLFFSVVCYPGGMLWTMVLMTD